MDSDRPAGASFAPKTSAAPKYGWRSTLAKISMAGLLFEILTGLAVTFLPFHPIVQWSIILHTAAGLLITAPLIGYCGAHLWEYRHRAFSQGVLLGYVSLAGILFCIASGVIVTAQGIWHTQTSSLWRQVHLITTFVAIIGVIPHVVFAAIKAPRNGAGSPARLYFVQTAVLVVVASIAAWLSFPKAGYSTYSNKFPEDYSFLYGTNRPFAPSLAKTDTGGAFDARSLAGSKSCGTAGCHEQIYEEWESSAHRYAAMDNIFQAIQGVMAKQNGPESTRYCGGCHDPISLFSGTKNLFVDNLSSLDGYQEGVSCLACHAIRETDIKGNANYTITQPHEYLWQWSTNGAARLARDFLIRGYPAEHAKLAKRSYKKPEYCAACHKQFIDQEVNRVGWVQLQNQYDNWAASHWNHKGDVQKTVECRECHMPLADSLDPAAGDTLDYNRKASDKKHRSHRFIAANTLMPVALKTNLVGWKQQLELTEQWLKGDLKIPEIESKWANGPIVKVALEAPKTASANESIPLRVVMTSNKVGHDFPTGPLDIIQSWLEVTVSDSSGREVFSSGKRDAKHFIQPGSFLFKAEPVDQRGNLIDRHNLWEMVGVRYRRALFPGYSDSVQYLIPCGIPTEGDNTKQSQGNAIELTAPAIKAPAQPGDYTINVSLQYRKVDQFLLNFLFGETNALTSPVTEIAKATSVVKVLPASGKTDAQSSIRNDQ
jgi:hypothetical protein